jgi:Helix-turn-helix domain
VSDTPGALTWKQVELLVAPVRFEILKETATRGALPATEILVVARRAGFEGSDTTARDHADKLQKAGVLERTSAPHVEFEATPAGQTLYELFRDFTRAD